jgi:EEF1A lysine methyltransferase 2
MYRFGEDSVEKMVSWALEYAHPSTAPSILEVGTGNGTLLFALLDAEYMPKRLQGIDYSPGSIKLAKSIATTRGGDKISFHLCDFLNEDPPTLPQQSSTDWDLIMDKGTFDAIALMEKDRNGMAPADGYPPKIARLLKPGGHFLITCTLPIEYKCIAQQLIISPEACNFTEEELRSKFANVQTGLVYHSRIQHATFTFGGKSGSICSSVAFQKPS